VLGGDKISRFARNDRREKGSTLAYIMTELKPTIFIVDDDDSVRKGLSRLLRSLEFNVEAYESAEQFLKRTNYQGIGCIILDVRMPGLSGMDLHDALIRVGYDLPIIFISGHGDIPMSVRAIRKGAVDFLPKPFDDEELLAAVNRAIDKDKKTKAESSEKRAILQRIEMLTPREYELLPYVISGMLNKQIAFKLGIAEKTVKIHRGRIMEKLGAHSVAELIRQAEKVGIGPPDELSNQ
jgi:FixJ family two-component response regulator